MRLVRNPLGFLEFDPKPQASALEEHYAQKYFQTERGSYSHVYSKAERESFLRAVDLAVISAGVNKP